MLRSPCKCRTGFFGPHWLGLLLIGFSKRNGEVKLSLPIPQIECPHIAVVSHLGDNNPASVFSSGTQQDHWDKDPRKRAVLLLHAHDRRPAAGMDVIDVVAHRKDRIFPMNFLGQTELTRSNLMLLCFVLRPATRRK